MVKMNLYPQVSKQMTRKDPDSQEPNNKSELNMALKSSQSVPPTSTECPLLHDAVFRKCLGVQKPLLSFNLITEHKLNIRKH